ncbi:hypothetical protein OXX79_010125 [Metschnikowia pulcherrima]
MSLHTNTGTYTLLNGKTIPKIALGTYLSNEGECAASVKLALQNGYRHIDTAAYYFNEEEVGQGIKESGVPREEIFVTTKVWNDQHKNVKGAFESSLKKLGLDYVDLYLMHWPISLDPETQKPYADWDYVDTYKEMQKLVHSGKAKSIGVSNFTVAKVRRLLADPEITIKPVVNQIEAHPLLPQPELTKWMQDEGIIIEAYRPLGSAQSVLITNETIVEIAKKNNVDAGQVLISWGVQRGTVVLPKSVKEKRLISNLKTFTLSEEDFRAVDTLSEKYGVQRTVDSEVFED